MLDHSRTKAEGKGRRWVFRIWVGITVILSIYIIAVLAFFRDDRVGQFAVGLPVPFIMALLLFLGLGWLVWLITSRRHVKSDS